MRVNLRRGLLLLALITPTQKLQNTAQNEFASLKRVVWQDYGRKFKF